MGIHGLTKLLSDEAPNCMKEVDLDSLTGRKVAVDASMAMYQFLVRRAGETHLVSEYTTFTLSETLHDWQSNSTHDWNLAVFSPFSTILFENLKMALRARASLVFPALRSLCAPGAKASPRCSPMRLER